MLLSTFRITKQQPTSPVETSSWAIYRNLKYGFEIKYPKDLILKESTVPTSYFDTYFLGDPIISINVPDSIKQNTNLGAAFIVISVSDNLSQCLKVRWAIPGKAVKKGEPLTEKRVINSVIFYEDSYIEGWTSNWMEALSLRTIYQNRCYSLNRFTKGTSIGESELRTVEESNKKEILETLYQVLSSFKFMK